MTIVDVTLVVFSLLMVCAFWITADRKVSDDLEQHERDPADASGPRRGRAGNDGGREFWPEADGNCGSNRSA